MTHTRFAWQSIALHVFRSATPKAICYIKRSYAADTHTCMHANVENSTTCGHNFSHCDIDFSGPIQGQLFFHNFVSFLMKHVPTNNKCSVPNEIIESFLLVKSFFFIGESPKEFKTTPRVFFPYILRRHHAVPIRGEKIHYYCENSIKDKQCQWKKQN